MKRHGNVCEGNTTEVIVWDTAVTKWTEGEEWTSKKQRLFKEDKDDVIKGVKLRSFRRRKTSDGRWKRQISKKERLTS